MDEWMANVDTFRVAFLRHCSLMAKVVGYTFEFDQAAIHAAHTAWLGGCETWKTSYVRDSTKLSHLKIMAILLCHLSSVEWITDLYDYDPANDDLEFSGSPYQKDEIRKDINAGRGTYLAFQFTIQVLNWFEQARCDKADPFVFRMTPDLEHDAIVYLLSERRDDMALFLFLKALYARD